MQILSIQLKNIKSHRDLELHFAPGINVLSGPNGVGKSTVFEAIGYALFGVDASSFVGNVDRFLTIGAKKGEVAVVFQVNGGERFRVTRTVGTPARWLLAREVGGAFEVEEHKDNDETEARLKELLGLDNGRRLKEQFTLVIGPFQNDFLGPFVEKRLTVRRDKFDEILGIDSWRKTFDKTSDILKAIKNKVDVLHAEIGPLQEQVAALPETLATRQRAGQDLEEAQQTLVRQQQALTEFLSQLTELDRREASLQSLAIEIEKLKGRTELGREKIASQMALIAEAEQARKTVAENTSGKEGYERASQSLVALREQAKTRQQLTQEVAELDKQVGRLGERCIGEVRAIERGEQELHDEERTLATKRQALAFDEQLPQLAEGLPQLRVAINNLRAQSGHLAGRRAGLEEGSEKLAAGACPFFQEPCLNIAEKPPGDVFSAKFAELAGQQHHLAQELARLEAEEGTAVEASDRLKAVAVQLAELDEQATKLAMKRKDNEARATELAVLQKEQAVVQQALSDKQLALQAFARLQAEIDAAEAQQRQHQAARDRFVAHQEQAARLEERQAELRKFETLLAQLQRELAGKENELATLGKDYDSDRHQALREQRDALGREIGALGQKVAGLTSEVARLNGEIDKLRRIAQEIAAKHEQLKGFGKREELVKFLRNRVFKQVSGYLSERFREEISLRANRIYRTIAESDEELAWGEDYRIVLRDLVDGELRERSDDQLSGGQTMSAVVALRLAMLQTIGARIAFFDEPTSNLDAARRENLASAFRAIDIGQEEVTEHWYDQLFLISHDVAFTEVTDQTIEIGSAGHKI